MTNEALTIVASTGLLANSSQSGRYPLASTTAGSLSIPTTDTEAEIEPTGAETNITLNIKGKGSGGGRLVSSNGKCAISAINNDLAALSGNAGDTEILGFDLTPTSFSIYDEIDPDVALLRMTNTESVFRDHVVVCGDIATPAGGSTTAKLLFGTTAGFGIYYGSGAPTVTAGQGSIYLRSDGSGVANRLYVNTDGGTTWTNFVSAA